MVAPIQAMMQAVPTPKALQAATKALHVGQTVDPEELAGWLVDREFERVDQVEEAGHFAIRGGILDIYSPGVDSPIRIEFFGDQIESIRTFDLGTQRSVDTLKRIEISAAPSGASETDTCPFFQYLHKNTLVILAEPLESIELGRLVLERLDDHTGLYSPEAIIRQSAEFGRLHIQRFGVGMAGPTLHMRITLLGAFSRATNEALDELLKMAAETNVIIYCDSPGEVDRMNELLRQHTAGDSQQRDDRVQGTGHREQQPDERRAASAGTPCKTRAASAVAPRRPRHAGVAPAMARKIRAGAASCRQPSKSSWAWSIAGLSGPRRTWRSCRTTSCSGGRSRGGCCGGCRRRGRSSRSSTSRRAITWCTCSMASPSSRASRRSSRTSGRRSS